MPFQTKDYQWNSVDVQGIDGFLHYGRVIDCAEEGLKIDFGCKGGLGPVLIPFGRIYSCKLQCFSDKSAMEKGRELAVEVLLRLAPDEPAKWYPSTLLTGEFSSSSSFGLIRAVTPGRIITEIVPGECVREQRNGVLEGLVEKDQFVKEEFVLPEGICSGSSEHYKTTATDQRIVDGFSSSCMESGILATHIEGNVLHMLKVSDDFCCKFGLNIGLHWNNMSSELQKRTLQRMLESATDTPSVAASKVQSKPAITHSTLPPQPDAPRPPNLVLFPSPNPVVPLRFWTPIVTSPRMYAPVYVVRFRGPPTSYYPMSPVCTPQRFPLIIPPPGNVVVCRVFPPGMLPHSVSLYPVYRIYRPHFVNGFAPIPQSCYQIRQLDAPAKVEEEIDIQTLPTDILIDIFKYLDTVSQKSVLPVCTNWYFTASSAAVNRVLLLPKQRSDRVVRVSLLKSWMPETKVIVYAGLETAGVGLEPKDGRTGVRGLLCNGKLFRCILQEKRFFRLDMMVLANLSWSPEMDRKTGNIMTGNRSGTGLFHKFISYICDELNTFAGVCKNLVLQDISVTQGSLDVDLSVHIPTGHIAGRLALDKLWESIEETLPALDYAGRVRVSMLIRDHLCQDGVIEILNDVQSGDPRRNNPFRGRHWTPADLAVVDMRKLSKLTLCRLLKQCSCCQMSITVCL